MSRRKYVFSNDGEMRGEERENLRILFRILKWAIFWISIILIFGVPFF